jgi:hypothetical protein
LKPREYTLKSDKQRKYGLIAQEALEAGLANAICTMQRDDINDFHVIDQNQVIAVLIGALQDLAKRISIIEG